MTASPVSSQFIKPLGGVFKRPPGADETEYLKLLKDRLARFEPEKLRAAAGDLAENASNQTWPLLTACITACENAKARRLAVENRKLSTQTWLMGAGVGAIGFAPQKPIKTNT